jgi:putative tryptophan/tyrosine transport system ATP-binding protein
MTRTLEMRDVSVSFNQGTPDELNALDKLTLSLNRGDYITIVGPNGAGKSTLLSAIAGAVPPTQGSITIEGVDVTRQADYRRARLVARVMQDPRQNTCGDLTVEENLAVAARRGERRSWLRRATHSSELGQALELLARYAPALQARRHDLVSRLSGGQRQVLAVVMAVTARPTVLLLDEHTSALDPQIAPLVMELTDELIASADVTTVMVTHNLRQALTFGTRLLIMCQGRVVDQVAGAEKAGMDELTMIERFRAAVAGQLTDGLIAG